MRNLFISFVLAMSSLGLYGADYSYLTFQTTDGTEYSVAVSGLTISFQNGYMTASDGTSLSLSSLNKMYFSTTSGITTLNSDANASDVMVFNSSGEQIGTYSSLYQALSSLGKGVFVIKDSNGKTQKRISK